jgi:hypothetical protein
MSSHDELIERLCHPLPEDPTLYTIVPIPLEDRHRPRSLEAINSLGEKYKALRLQALNEIYHGSNGNAPSSYAEENAISNERWARALFSTHVITYVALSLLPGHLEGLWLGMVMLIPEEWDDPLQEEVGCHPFLGQVIHYKVHDLFVRMEARHRGLRRGLLNAVIEGTRDLGQMMGAKGVVLSTTFRPTLAARAVFDSVAWNDVDGSLVASEAVQPEDRLELVTMRKLIDTSGGGPQEARHSQRAQRTHVA